MPELRRRRRRPRRRDAALARPGPDRRRAARGSARRHRARADRARQRRPAGRADARADGGPDAHPAARADRRAARARRGRRHARRPGARGRRLRDRPGQSGDATPTPENEGTNPSGCATPSPGAGASPSPDSGAGSSGAIASWPSGKTAWTVILESATSESAADAKANELAGQGTTVGVLHSDDYSSLKPGYWVVFSGQYDSQSAAQSAADGLKSQVPEAYARHVVPG